jgi:hypothetical protein
MQVSLEALHDAVCNAYFSAEPAPLPADDANKADVRRQVTEQTQGVGASSSALRTAKREQSSAPASDG